MCVRAVCLCLGGGGRAAQGHGRLRRSSGWEGACPGLERSPACSSAPCARQPGGVGGGAEGRRGAFWVQRAAAGAAREAAIAWPGRRLSPHALQLTATCSLTASAMAASEAGGRPAPAAKLEEAPLSPEIVFDITCCVLKGSEEPPAKQTSTQALATDATSSSSRCVHWRTGMRGKVSVSHVRCPKQRRAGAQGWQHRSGIVSARMPSSPALPLVAHAHGPPVQSQLVRACAARACWEYSVNDIVVLSALQQLIHSEPFQSVCASVFSPRGTDFTDHFEPARHDSRAALFSLRSGV